MVRCDGCGFLSMRRRSDRALCEVEGPIRQTGEVPLEASSPSSNLYEDAPVCYARAADLAKELRGTRPADRLAVIQKDRDCASFTPWQQGFSPKEHREMIDSAALREWMSEDKRQAQAREDRRRAEDQAREERLEAEREKRRQEEREREHHWLEQQRLRDRRWQLLVAFLTACLGVVGGALAAWLKLK
jgi:hypothetical protein